MPLRPLLRCYHPRSAPVLRGPCARLLATSLLCTGEDLGGSGRTRSSARWYKENEDKGLDED